MNLLHRGFEIGRLLSLQVVYEYLPQVCWERLSGWGCLVDSLIFADF
jgi:hypothetical protein